MLMNKYAARAVRKQAKKNTKRLKAIPTRAKLIFAVAMAPKNTLKTHPLKKRGLLTRLKNRLTVKVRK
jgi:hypothetical protein